MMQITPCRLATAAALILLLAGTPLAAAETNSGRLVHAANGARLETPRGSVDLPSLLGLEASSVVPLAAASDSAVGAGPAEDTASAWLVAGVRPAPVSLERAEDGRLYAPEPKLHFEFHVVRVSGAGDEATVHPIAAPNVAAPALRSLAPLVTDGALDGLAWLEGDDDRSLAVRFAARQGRGDGDASAAPTWGGTETVALAGPGSQLALRAARLHDGSVLLTWSRFDGEDDEIFWSVRRAGIWSTPRSLGADDATPDITPALVAVPGGALAAWASYETDRGGDAAYRILVSRYDGDTWSEPVYLPGTGTFPSLEAAGREGLPTVLFRTTAGWRVVELDDEGSPLRHADAIAESTDRRRPSLIARDGGGPTLAWPVTTGQATEQSALTWAAPDRGSTPPAGTGEEGSR